MVAVKVDVTEQDFLKIREALKNYLKSQREFLDYDFEGSSMAVILDVLAYNAAMNAFNANMVGNEMFINSAILRDSIASRAKMLGYFPRSKRSAVSYIDVEITPNDSPSTITIPRGTKFHTRLENKNYTFSTLEGHVVYPDAQGKFKITRLPITEGEVLTHRFTWDEGDPDQRFIIPNPGVDTTTMRVRLQQSTSNLTTYVFRLADDLNVIGPDSRVYFLQEIEGGKHEIYFGDGIVGVKPAHGNIVIIDYIVSHGSGGNGLSIFSPTNGVGGYKQVKITNPTKSSGGSEEEDEESIRYLAPLSFQAQGRAITGLDYETIVKKDYPNIDSIRVWGGEQNDPPYYGRVFVAIKPLDGTVLSDQTKNHLVTNVIRKRNMVGVDVQIVDPDYIYLVVETVLKWRADLTSDSEADVQNAVKDAIIAYGERELDNFDTYFRFSRFVQQIDASHPSVKNNLTSIKLKYRMNTSLLISQDYIINFSNSIDSNDTSLGEPTLSSSSFTYEGYTCFFDDDAKGKVRIYRLLEGVKIIVRSNIGSIDYTSGRVQINDFLPSAIAKSLPYIEITVRPLESDVKTQRDQLLLIDEPAIFIDMVDESGTIRAD